MISFLKYLIDRVRWKRRNKHNRTFMSSAFDTNLVKVGKGTYGPLSVYAAGKDSLLVIGSYCSIAPKVSFVFNNEHNTNTFSTYPFKAITLKHEEPEASSKGGIQVGDDVWIGFGATILDGVTIGSGAVVGAGAVVAKDIPPYAIAVGVPAKVIKYRFDAELRKRLLEIDYGRINEKFVAENIGSLYKPLDGETLRVLVCQLKEE